MGYGGLIIFLTWPVSVYSVEKSGLFGDSFGVVSSLFTGLAFVGIIVALFYQREDIKIQRDDLELTRIEMSETRKEMINQRKILTKQNFETTFFQMTRLFNEIVNSIDLPKLKRDIPRNITGRDCFVTFFKHVKEGWSNLHNLDKAREKDMTVSDFVYEEFYNKFRHEVSHYFKYLYSILLFLWESESQEIDFYSKIFKAQLSDHELLLIFYHVKYISNVWEPRRINFKELIEKLSVFDELPEGLLLDVDEKSCYSNEAYKIPLK